jgi:hypothetical protein
MADYTPVYADGVVPFSATTSAAVVGGTILAVSGAGTVATAGAGSTAAAGVAAFDAPSGGRVSVWPLNNVIHEVAVVAAGTVTAGDGVATGASGTAATIVVGTGAAAGSLIGTATTTASAPNKVRFIGRG